MRNKGRGSSYLNPTMGDNLRVFHYLATLYKKTNQVGNTHKGLGFEPLYKKSSYLHEGHLFSLLF